MGRIEKMNDFVVMVGEKKFEISTNRSNKVLVNNYQREVELSKLSDYSYLLKVDNRVYQITSEKIDSNNYSFFIDGFSYDVSVRTLLEEKAFELLKNKSKDNHSDIVKSPMPGLVLKIKKTIGDKVEMGESIILLEAMKMENDIRASSSGVIKEILVSENTAVEKNETLVVIG
ncbi:MAG: acetyl-CoA carboxylase biotin carboxyl carrier protein subunit [Ignavibacteriae bacterium]|nr:acetyl-CoA carboxylase biotin carboxyl carrier protein subunit [Ignavibacteriota bacterium]